MNKVVMNYQLKYVCMLTTARDNTYLQKVSKKIISDKISKKKKFATIHSCLK